MGLLNSQSIAFVVCRLFDLLGELLHYCELFLNFLGRIRVALVMLQAIDELVGEIGVAVQHCFPFELDL